MNADTKTIRALAEVMADKALTRVELHQGETQIVLERGGQAVPAGAAPVVDLIPQAPAAEPTAPPKAPAEGEAPKGRELTAPLVGVGYTAPEPGAAPFVKPGDNVKRGQVLCIIEAMKVMNEFTAPEDGTLLEVCFEDGQLLEFGQCLFRLA